MIRKFVYFNLAMAAMAVVAAPTGSFANEAKELSKLSPAAGANAIANEEIVAADPRDFVTKLTDKVLQIIRRDGLTDKQKETSLIKLFTNHVDSKWMAQFVLGRYWRDADAGQKKKYTSLYQDYLIQSYVPRFREYEGEEYEILRITDEGSRQYTIQSKLKGENGKPDVRVDYRIHKKGGKFLIIDVVGEGISLITTQRSDFGGMISRKGLDHFIEKLEEKVKKMDAV